MYSKKIIAGLISYLKDWRNLLAHGLVGLAILLLALFLPVRLLWRIIVLVVVVAGNITRMSIGKRRERTGQTVTDVPVP